MYRKKPENSGYVKTAREKYLLLKTSWTYQTRQFFENSTLHGVRYIDEEGRPFWEKFMWFCVTAIGGVVTLIIIVSLWEKFQTNPTITGLDTDFHNWDVPFPAVSLCPFRPANVTALDQLVEAKKLNTNNAQVYKDLLIELTNISWANMKNFQKFKGASYLPESNLKDLITGAYITCYDVMHQCMFKGYDYPCCSNQDSLNNETSFQGLLTEIGFCFTFNSRHTGHAGRNKDDSFKVKLIYETDDKWILSFDIFEPPDEEQGPVYKVFIHSTDEMPSVELSPQHIWDRRIAKIMFSSKQTYTTDEARQLSIRQRRCIFKDEVHLKTDTIYTYSACMSQCRMLKAHKLCRCVPFFYKQIDGFPHCELKGLVCIAEHIEVIMNDDDCECELGCMNTVYEVEKLTDVSNTKANEPLEVGFVSWPMVQYKREVLFGWVDLLVSFGGIAGLFLGFSLLSGVEVVYYFTMRACCMVYRNRAELKRLQTEYANVEKPPLDLSLTPKFMKKQGGDRSETKVIEVGTNKVTPLPHAMRWNINTNINSINPKANFPAPPFNLEFLN